MSHTISRRDALRLAAAVPLAAVGRQGASKVSPLEAIGKSPARVVLADGKAADKTLVVTRTWTGRACASQLRNTGSSPARVREVVLFDYRHGLPATTPLYGEGFQMLSQTGGTLGTPADLGNYTDVKHYRLVEPDGSRALFGMMTLSPAPDAQQVLAFTSARRFVGKFRLQPSSIHVVVDTENLEIAPGEQWELEEFVWNTGRSRPDLLSGVADRLTKTHPRLRTAAPPSGWCSWYCFGPNVTAEQVLANLDVIASRLPGLKYIQIDDGYQPAMGDWLETGKAFGGQVQTVLKEIRARGFEPAIWVAPFIAEAESRLFKEHPDWFVKDETGAPLRADKVTFGGWRRGPWYALDGTHPDAQAHLTNVFSTMRKEWGCTYFKLDANFWGAIHGGRFQDAKATRVEAYRRGMAAVLKGSGDAFILGCNHPIWPSVGVIHGSRSSNDIRRAWDRISTTARQNLMRNWQNDTLWWNDPDAVCLTGDLSEEVVRFHATAIYATGGMILSGDDLTKMTDAQVSMLRKLQPPTGRAARFENDALEVGRVQLANGIAMIVLNWTDKEKDLRFQLDGLYTVSELWSGFNYNQREGWMTITVPPQGGRIMVCTKT